MNPRSSDAPGGRAHGSLAPDDGGSNDDGDIEVGSDKGIEMPNQEGYTIGLTGSQTVDWNMSMTEQLYEGMDQFMWTEGWGDWGF